MRSRPPSLFHLLAAAAVLAVAMLATAAPALAEDSATKAARKHFQKGEKLFALGRFDEALTSYEAAFEAKPLPGFLFNIGQCHRNLGDLDSAIFSFRKYLELDPDAEDRDEVLELIDELEVEQQELEDERRDRPLQDPDPPDRRGDDRAGKPIYKRWWFWGGIALVAAGAGTGTFLLLRDDGVPDTDLGHVVFR